jgi:hypothetical protein
MILNIPLEPSLMGIPSGWLFESLKSTTVESPRKCFDILASGGTIFPNRRSAAESPVL